MAMGAAPTHLFEILSKAGVTSSLWNGCLDLKASSSFRYHPEGIIAAPLQALARPIQSWHTLLYEIGHHLFRLLNIRNKTEEVRKQVLRNLELDIAGDQWGVGSGRPPFRLPVSAFDSVFEEVFCNWFQYKQ